MSTKDDRKRERERFFLEEFLRHVPGLRFVEHGQTSEWPDFVVEDDRGRIGLELTQLFRDDSPKGSPTVAAEKRRSKLLREVARRYYAAGGPPAHVSAVRIGQPEGSNIDDAVLLLLKAAARTGNDYERIEVPDRARPTRSPWALLYFTRLAAEVGAHSDWNACENSCAFVGRVKTESLRACIDEKAANLPRYRRHLDRVALLIYVERNRGSGMIEPPAVPLRLDGAGFEAVHLLMHLRVGGPPLLRVDAGGEGLASAPHAL
jgi:hypothetical protein